MRMPGMVYARRNNRVLWGTLKSVYCSASDRGSRSNVIDAAFAATWP